MEVRENLGDRNIASLADGRRNAMHDFFNEWFWTMI